MGADLVRRADGASRADGPLGIVQVDQLRREHIHIGLPQAGDGADVGPVALKAIRPELLAVPEHAGDNVLAEVLVGVGIIFVGNQVLAQLLPVEDVNAHGGKGALGVLGLLLELFHIAVRADIHNAEAGGLLQRDGQDRDSASGVVLQMLAQHVGIVHLINLVTGEDENVFRVIFFNEGQILVNGVGRAGEPGALLARGLVWRENENTAVVHVQVPGLAAADVAVELQGTVLGQNTDGVNTGVCAVGKGEVDDSVFASERHAGFGGALGQGVQTGTLSACQKHCDKFFLHGQPPQICVNCEQDSQLRTHAYRARLTGDKPRLVGMRARSARLREFLPKQSSVKNNFNT